MLPQCLHQVLAHSDLIREQMKFEDFQDGHLRGHLRYRNDFCNSEFLCHSDTSHQVWAESTLRFGRRCHLKNFKMAALAAIFNVGMEHILAVLNLHVSPMPPIKFSALSDLPFGSRCFKIFKLVVMLAILDIGMERILQF